MCSDKKERLREPELYSVINSTLSLVHISVGMPRTLFCIDAEQVRVRGCPAITVVLEQTMLTIGGEGAAQRRRCVSNVTGTSHSITYLQLTIIETVPSPIYDKALLISRRSCSGLAGESRIIKCSQWIQSEGGHEQ